MQFSGVFDASTPTFPLQACCLKLAGLYEVELLFFSDIGSLDVDLVNCCLDIVPYQEVDFFSGQI